MKKADLSKFIEDAVKWRLSLTTSTTTRPGIVAGSLAILDGLKRVHHSLKKRHKWSPGKDRRWRTWFAMFTRIDI
jgi:hypothetical protein